MPSLVEFQDIATRELKLTLRPFQFNEPVTAASLKREFDRVQITGPLAVYSWVWETQDSYMRERPIVVLKMCTDCSVTGKKAQWVHHSCIYVGRGLEQAQAWLFETMIGVFRHELGECFRVDGALPYAPHRGTHGLTPKPGLRWGF